MCQKSATVILPTTGDRGPLLPYSVGSILNQTVNDIEIFIMGDGVDDSTREIIYGLIKRDSRVRFFDHPKDISRGEKYRHKALQEARGKIVCYLLDRDIMLPFHIENLLKYYDKYNVVTSKIYSLDIDETYIKDKLTGEPDDNFKNQVMALQDINNMKYSPEDFTKDSYNKKKISFKPRIVFPLSSISHSLEFYHSLPHGWRTTPPGYYTDQFMELQLYSANNSNMYFSIDPPSILYFKRENHPGWPVDKRIELLIYWDKSIQDGTFKEKMDRLLFIGKIKITYKESKKKCKRSLRKLKKFIYNFFK